MRILRIDLQPNITRTRGVRFGWKRNQQKQEPYHYSWRWVQAHVVTWERTPERPGRKIQFEIKTYVTDGPTSVAWSKRYVRLGVCL